jgi:ADP-ribose pyrophosphatase
MTRRHDAPAAPTREENRRIHPGDAGRGEIQLLDETVVWRNGIVRLLNVRVRFPARGGSHAEGEHFRLAPDESRADGVVVVPIAADDRILLVRQFRHPMRMWLRELPRGSRDRGETPEAAAAREVREELGHEVERLHPLGRVAPDSGQLAALPFLFAARVRPAAGGEPEREEAIDAVLACRYSELRRDCERGAILDGLTLAAVVRLAPHFDGDRFVYRSDAMPTAPSESVLEDDSITPPSELDEP